MDTATIRLAGVTPRAAVVCLACALPVTILGDPEWGKAVHEKTAREQGPDGHLAAPVDADVVRAAIAREARGNP